MSLNRIDALTYFRDVQRAEDGMTQKVIIHFPNRNTPHIDLLPQSIALTSTRHTRLRES